MKPIIYLTAKTTCPYQLLSGKEIVINKLGLKMWICIQYRNGKHLVFVQHSTHFCKLKIVKLAKESNILSTGSTDWTGIIYLNQFLYHCEMCLRKIIGKNILSKKVSSTASLLKHKRNFASQPENFYLHALKIPQSIQCHNLIFGY